jgi:hypothetical protein
MRKGWRIALWIYLAGVAISESICLWLYGTGDLGPLQRPHSLHDWLIAAAVYLVAAAIWPYWVVVFLLHYFGFVSK